MLVAKICGDLRLVGWSCTLVVEERVRFIATVVHMILLATVFTNSGRPDGGTDAGDVGGDAYSPLGLGYLGLPSTTCEIGVAFVVELLNVY